LTEDVFQRAVSRCFVKQFAAHSPVCKFDCRDGKMNLQPRRVDPHRASFNETRRVKHVVNSPQSDGEQFYFRASLATAVNFNWL